MLKAKLTRQPLDPVYQSYSDFGDPMLTFIYSSTPYGTRFMDIGAYNQGEGFTWFLEILENA